LIRKENSKGGPKKKEEQVKRWRWKKRKDGGLQTWAAATSWEKEGGG